MNSYSKEEKRYSQMLCTALGSDPFSMHSTAFVYFVLYVSINASKYLSASPLSLPSRFAVSSV